MSNTDQHLNDDLESPERREALKAIRKYGSLGTVSAVVVLSSADAVKAMGNSRACVGKPNPPPWCP